MGLKDGWSKPDPTDRTRAKASGFAFQGTVTTVPHQWCRGADLILAVTHSVVETLARQIAGVRLESPGACVCLSESEISSACPAKWTGEPRPVS